MARPSARAAGFTSFPSCFPPFGDRLTDSSRRLHASGLHIGVGCGISPVPVVIQKEVPVTATVEVGQDEYVVDNPRLRAFIAEVTRIRHEHDDPRQILAAIRPHFAELLADKTWLPEQYQE